MNTSIRTPGAGMVGRIPMPGHRAHVISCLAPGMALSLFLAISYMLCVLGYVFWPNLPIEHSALSIFLPGFTLLTWSSFILGLVESFGWGWYHRAVFAPIHNFFAAFIQAFSASSSPKRGNIMQTQQFRVSGMTCGGCTSTFTRALQGA